MSQFGRLIGDVFGSIGLVLAIAGPGLLAMQYFISLSTDIWHPINIRVIFDAISVSTPEALDALLKAPLWVAMFTLGLAFMWIAAEMYERHARSLRGKADR
jgi:hypothetical protein